MLLAGVSIRLLPAFIRIKKCQHFRNVFNSYVSLRYTEPSYVFKKEPCISISDFTDIVHGS